MLSLLRYTSTALKPFHSRHRIFCVSFIMLDRRASRFKPCQTFSCWNANWGVEQVLDHTLTQPVPNRLIGPLQLISIVILAKGAVCFYPFSIVLKWVFWFNLSMWLQTLNCTSCCRFRHTLVLLIIFCLHPFGWYFVIFDKYLRRGYEITGF